MSERPWKYDPVVFQYFACLQATLRRSDAVDTSGDLLARLDVASHKSLDADNSQKTTEIRATWCCLVALYSLLNYIHPGLVSPKGLFTGKRPVPLCPELLPMLKALREQFEDLTSVAHAEFVMGLAPANGEQVTDTKRRKALDGLAHAKKMEEHVHAYLSSRQLAEAAEIGKGLADVLMSIDKPRDELVRIAELLVEIHA
jgi:hypothetical protein